MKFNILFSILSIALNTVTPVIAHQINTQEALSTSTMHYHRSKDIYLSVSIADAIDTILQDIKNIVENDNFDVNKDAHFLYAKYRDTGSFRGMNYLFEDISKVNNATINNQETSYSFDDILETIKKYAYTCQNHINLTENKKLAYKLCSKHTGPEFSRVSALFEKAFQLDKEATEDEIKAIQRQTATIQLAIASGFAGFIVYHLFQ